MKKLTLLLTATCLTACSVSAKDPAISTDAATVQKGAEIYATMCASCHGDDLTGGSAPTLFDDEWVYGGSNAEIVKSIVSGIEEAGMPAFDTFSPEEESDLITFIKSGGDALKTIDPVTDVPLVMDQVKVETWVNGVDEAWGMAFIPGTSGDMLITEKGGRFVKYADGGLTEITGIPEVFTNGQAGLLDVAFDPDYDSNGWIYLTYSDPLEAGSSEAMTRLIRGRIEGTEWVDEETLFKAKPEHYLKSRVHYGSRITFDAAGYLFFSIGDRGPKEMAQDLTRPNGKIHRINRDGTIPEDNPFVSETGAYPSIYAYGNRNPQGLIIHPDTDVLWETEHGPRGGDELNAIKAGVNYGWPEISYGINYNGTVLTPHTAKPGMAQPKSQWTPSIAVCGLDVYTGDLFPEWKGRLIAGGLAFETVRLIEVDGDQYVGEVELLKDEGRVRDVTTGPDGAIYVALPTRIARLSPK